MTSGDHRRCRLDVIAGLRALSALGSRGAEVRSASVRARHAPFEVEGKWSFREAAFSCCGKEGRE